MHKRGLIREGFYADLVLFNPETIRDNATYVAPFEKPDGIDMVMVNGDIALENGAATGKLSGKVLRSK